MLDLSEVKWLLQRAPAWACVLSISQHLPICHPSSLTEWCRMALVWVPATQLVLLEGTAGQAGPAMLHQSNKKRQVCPQRSRFFHTALLPLEGFQQGGTQIQQTYRQHTFTHNEYKAPFTTYCSSSAGQWFTGTAQNTHEPPSFRGKTLWGSTPENYFKSSHYSVALLRSHFPYSMGTWCFWNFVENEWKMASRSNSLQPCILTDLKHFWLW